MKNKNLSLILSFILIIHASFAIAQEKTYGEKLLEKGTALWERFTVDMSSVPRDTVVSTLERAVRALVEEGDPDSLCEGLVMLSQVYIDDCRTFGDAKTLAEYAMTLSPEKKGRNYCMAQCLIANHSLIYNPSGAIRMVERINFDSAITSLVDYFLYARITANACYWSGDYASASSFYNTIYNSFSNPDETAILDKYSIVSYISASLEYAYYLISRGGVAECFNIIRYCDTLIERYELENSSVMVSALRTWGYLMYRAGEYDDAINSLEAAIVLSRAYCGRTSVELIECTRVLSEAYSVNKQYDKARRFLNDAIDAMDDMLGNSLYGASLYAARGLVWFQERNYLKSSEDYYKVVRINSHLRYYEPQTYCNLANSLRLAGKVEESLDVVGKAVREFKDHLRNTFLSLSDRGRENYWALFGSYNIRLMTVVAATPEDKYGTLYNLALLSKNLLMDCSSQFLSYVNDQADEAVKRKWAEYLSVQQQLSDMIVLSEKDENKYLELHDRLTGIESELMFDVNVAGSYLNRLDCDWEQVASHLGEDDVAIEFLRYSAWNTKETRYIASVLRHGEAPVNIPLPDMKEEILVAMPVGRIYNDTALYDALFKPLEKYLRGGKRVFFSLAGALNAIAVENLLTPNERRMSELYQMYRLSSTRQLLEPDLKQTWKSAVIFGGFDFNLGLEEMEYYAETTTNRGKDSGMHNWMPLPGSLEEANLVGGRLASLHPTIVKGEEGVEERFKLLSGKGVNLIHVATHGYFDKEAARTVRAQAVSEEDEAMEASGLVFSGANNMKPLEGIDDGLLSSREISRMNLIGCDLVVLSSCGSGLGITDAINESYGLVRAFKKAGCQSILMSLGDIDDNASRLFMEFFYDARTGGADNGQALTFAKEKLKKVYPDPKYWAPFVLID